MKIEGSHRTGEKVRNVPETGALAGNGIGYPIPEPFRFRRIEAEKDQGPGTIVP